MQPLLALLLLCVAAHHFVAAARAASRPPNVLFILTDDQRWDALGLAGHRHLKTPHLDRLGQEGVYFKNAFCTTSLCSPSRASILSGLYAHAHGVVNNFTEYPTRLQSFPLVLQARGYATAYIGKWHMGEDNDEPRPGFDWFVTHKGQGKYFDTEFNFHGQRREVVPGYYNCEAQFPYTPNVRSVRTETWKYTRSPHGDGGPDRHMAELYNIEFDPEERYNLIARPKYASVVKQMQAELVNAMKEVGLDPDHDPMPLDAGIKQELPDQKIR
ncbi:MAG: sulfatase-like hydrolase/transferase [Verrucomicrobiales bacterium]|nr:sulfatase-like hydrolase/transferase [Verrucomicrobiales bacterium]